MRGSIWSAVSGESGARSASGTTPSFIWIRWATAVLCQVAGFGAGIIARGAAGFGRRSPAPDGDAHLTYLGPAGCPPEGRRKLVAVEQQLLADDRRVGLAGADMGACNILPRIVGAGRAAELLYTGRVMDGNEAERWGFYNKLSEPENVLADAQALAKVLSDGPTFANSMTKKCLHQEWNMGVEEAIEAEAQAQAICMQTKDYERAYEAFVAKQKPVFQGN